MTGFEPPSSEGVLREVPEGLRRRATGRSLGPPCQRRADPHHAHRRGLLVVLPLLDAHALVLDAAEVLRVGDDAIVALVVGPVCDRLVSALDVVDDLGRDTALHGEHRALEGLHGRPPLALRERQARSIPWPLPRPMLQLQRALRGELAEGPFGAVRDLADQLLAVRVVHVEVERRADRRDVLGRLLPQREKRVALLPPSHLGVAVGRAHVVVEGVALDPAHDGGKVLVEHERELLEVAHQLVLGLFFLRDQGTHVREVKHKSLANNFVRMALSVAFTSWHLVVVSARRKTKARHPV